MSCCCGAVGQLLSSIETPKFVTECEVTHFLYQNVSHDRNSVFTVPKNGHYITYLTATGGNIKTALFHEPGTEIHIEYLREGQEISYKLGDTSTATFPSGYVLTATKKDGVLTEPAIAFQNLGDIETPASVVNTFGGGYQYPRTLDRHAGFSVKGIVPASSDINYMSTGRISFQYWAVAEVDFPRDGNYTFGAIGDDYANLFLDGVPVVMYSNTADRKIMDEKIGSTGGKTTIPVTAGKHFIYLWNLSNVCCHIHSGMFVKDEQGVKIAASDEDTNWRYIRSPVNCLDEVNAELLPQPNMAEPLSART